MGRDHTIHATAHGFVKFYRDPERHPDRKFIGVTFEKDDILPYPRHAERKRKLNMDAIPRKPDPPPPSELVPSGIPRQVVQVAAFRKDPRKPRPAPRILKLRDDYSYREDNWQIGKLQDREEKTFRRGRSGGFKKYRMKKVREIQGQKKGAERRMRRVAREKEKEQEKQAS